MVHKEKNAHFFSWFLLLFCLVFVLGFFGLFFILLIVIGFGLTENTAKHRRKYESINSGLP